MQEKSKTGDSFGAGLVASPPLKEEATVIGVYTAECYDKDGNLKWSETFDNVVTDVGKASMLDNYFGTSSGGTASGANAMGLKGTGAAASTNTMTSHAAWLEVGGANAPAYSSGTRPTPTFGAASGVTTVNKVTSAVSFTFTSGGTVAGAFICVGTGATTKDATTGTLYSAGDFASSRTVVSTDVLNVTYTATLS